MIVTHFKKSARAAPPRFAWHCSPNQVLTHAARAAAKQLNSSFSATLWPRAARAKGPGQGNGIAGVPEGCRFAAASRAWPQGLATLGNPTYPCRFTTYRHRFARAAPAPRAKRNDIKRRFEESWTCIARQTYPHYVGCRAAYVKAAARFTLNELLLIVECENGPKMLLDAVWPTAAKRKPRA